MGDADDADGEPDAAAAAGDLQPSNKETSPTLSGSDEATVIGTQSNALRDTEATEPQAVGHPSPSLSTSMDGQPISPMLQSVAVNSGQGDAASVSSNDSGPLWEAVGSLPRSTPALAQFDENEFASFEDGEVVDEEDEGPPPNQEANRTRNREDTQRLDEYVGTDRKEAVMDGFNLIR
ncbi:hypothetical protein K466DRAFT_597739 [Polyporus arcularius HHB13444]|uniref:Uncharacterized protein n=1 Tax=Polyporus arcularius HHB13444 TaxID=1314778 RepID=A0A5C3PTK3_9APHY|nr:hypothetical protein K466DRAFT_597739 [Polyporus arcularius HHB13444]